MNSVEAKARLVAGNQRYVADTLQRELQDPERRDSLTGGQKPFAIILSCADSRVVPEMIFDTGLGELFVLRVAGNVANTSTIASIEYAVAHLGTKLIVVLGHQSCGAVTAAIAGGDNGYNLNHLLSHIQPAISSSDDSSVDGVVRENAVKTCQELANRSDIIVISGYDGRAYSKSGGFGTLRSTVCLSPRDSKFSRLSLSCLALSVTAVLTSETTISCRCNNSTMNSCCSYCLFKYIIMIKISRIKCYL